MKRLDVIRLLLTYLYTAPSHSGGINHSSDHVRFYVFRPDKVPLALVEPETSKRGYEDGYVGLQDGRIHFWALKTSRIFPASRSFWIRDDDLSSNLNEFFSHAHNWALRSLFDQPASGEIHQRVIVALQWYARSCRLDVAEDEAIVFLSIALESLIKVSQGEKLTERFKEGVLTLIGPVSRLDSWLEQFYQARSKLVHEGTYPHLYFLAADREAVKRHQKNPKEEALIPHRLLIEYGRRIFRMCMVGFLSGATLADAGGLADLFVHNAERLKKIRDLLKAGSSPANDRLIAASRLVRGLEIGANYDLMNMERDVSTDLLTQVCGLVVHALKEAVTTLPSDAQCLLEEAASNSGTLSTGQLGRLERLSIRLAQEDVRTGCFQSVAKVVSEFLTYATGPPFKVRISTAEYYAKKG